MLEDHNVCNCECHDPESTVLHCMPCCDGECPVCGFPVLNMKAHLLNSHDINYNDLIIKV
jgi:hypothetical protein